MRRIEDVRRDIPLFAGADAKHAFAQCLRDAVLTEWDPEIVDEFLAEMDAKSAPRPRLSLPLTATPAIIPAEEWRVRWNGNRDLTIQTSSDGRIAVTAHGRRWEFAEAARPLLALLVLGEDCGPDDLARAAEGLSTEVIRTFVRELVTNGLLVVV
jgi:hypothetical protein